METARIRNFGIAAHIDAGKTTVSERMLFHAGVEHRVGQVDEGTAVMDWMSEERERGITITSAATTLPWQEHALNLIDTPGHVDFTVEVERCMRILDGAVLVLDGVAGVQAQSETVLRQMQRYRVPYVAFVNKLDRAGADFLFATGTLRTRLGAPVIPIQFPIFEGGAPSRIVDLLTLQTWDFRPGADPSAPRDLPIPVEQEDEVGVLRAELLETLAEDDEELLQLVVEGQDPAPEALRAALRRRTIERSLVPVLCGAALREIGVQPLMDAVVAYLPAPLDVPPIVGRDPESGGPIERRPDPDGPPTALAFKLHAGPHGDLTFVRTYCGTIEPGMALWNPRARRKERVQRILRMHAVAGVALERIGPGEIVALTGLKWTGTGDTLCTREAPVLLEELVFPEPVIQRVVEPASAAEREKLGAALERLAHEDPSFHVRAQEDTGQWLIEGMGELHLEVIEHRLTNEFRVSPHVGQPRVAYREAVVGSGAASGTVDRVLGGKEVFGAIDLEVLPDAQEPRARVEFAPDLELPAAWRPAVEEALLLEARVGPRFGYPMVQARVRVTGSRSRPPKDAEIAYVQAAVSALRQAMQAAQVVIEEPLMAFEIGTPSEFASGIIADLNSRHAELNDVGAEQATRTLKGEVPLSAMFGYSTAVRSLSQGRASFSMTPSGFRAVPESELAVRGLVWS